MILGVILYFIAYYITISASIIIALKCANEVNKDNETF